MQKILKPLAGILFTAFIIGMFLLVISLTFSALGRIFPDNFSNQVIGLVLFDLAALCWGLAFVYRSESVFQYGIAALGFLVGLAGTVVMVASEVMLSASNLTTPPDWIGKAMTYGFIGAAVIHLILGYAHAAASPEVDAQIRLGASQAEITSEAIRQAEQELESHRAALGDAIRPRLVANIKRNLNLPVSDAEYAALDIIEAKPKANGHGLPATLWNTITGKRKRAQATTTYEATADMVHTCHNLSRPCDNPVTWPATFCSKECEIEAVKFWQATNAERLQELEGKPGESPAPFPLDQA